MKHKDEITWVNGEELCCYPHCPNRVKYGHTVLIYDSSHGKNTAYAYCLTHAYKVYSNLVGTGIDVSADVYSSVAMYIPPYINQSTNDPLPTSTHACICAIGVIISTGCKCGGV
jgi:hypothetical protein